VKKDCDTCRYSHWHSGGFSCECRHPDRYKFPGLRSCMDMKRLKKACGPSLTWWGKKARVTE